MDWKPTDHFLKRWNEYFPELNWEQEFQTARRLGSKTRKRVREQCPVHKHEMALSGQKFYLINGYRTIIFMLH